MKQAVICLVKTYTQADILVGQLKNEGFTNSDISVLMPDESGVRDMGYEKHSKAPEGTSAGAGAGALVGGAIGVLAGIGLLSIPGLGAFVAAGPIMAGLSGAAVGGAVGGVTGGLIGLGVPEYEAKQYEGKLREGNLLISIHTEDNAMAKRAEDVCKNNGAYDVSVVAEEKVASNR
jgi:hypothetical protein